MKALAHEHAVSDLCEALAVSRSGYYAWLEQPVGVRARANAELVPQIQKVFARHRGCYGSPRVCASLRQQGVRCNRKRVARLMQEQGLRAITTKRYRVQTTDSRHAGPIAPNLLPEKVVSAANQAWVVDLTYIPTDEGWLYLAGVLDRYSRKLVGWAMAEHLETSLPLSALQMACHHRDYAIRTEAKQSLFVWIETYYNRVRLHSALGYQSPMDFENQLS